MTLLPHLNSYLNSVEAWNSCVRDDDKIERETECTAGKAAPNRDREWDVYTPPTPAEFSPPASYSPLPGDWKYRITASAMPTTASTRLL